MADKTQFGPNDNSLKVLERLMDQGIFKEENHAAKFAMSVAIKSGVKPDTEKGGGETKWNIGGFDKEGHIRGIIQALFPQVEEPVRAIEYFINKGFEIIDQKIGLSTSIDPIDLFMIGEEEQSK